MRFSLRSLLVLVAVAPPVMAGVYFAMIRQDVLFAIVSLASFVVGLTVVSLLAGLLMLAPFWVACAVCRLWSKGRRGSSTGARRISQAPEVEIR